MNKAQAKKIAETITNMELQAMFDRAKVGITDWTKTSVCNKGLSKGTAWNILASDFDLAYNHHILAKTNMVREFGEFLPHLEERSYIRKTIPTAPVHQEPNFKNYEKNNE